MSKVSAETLQEAIAAVLQHALTDKKRNFTETIELQISLKNYDPNKDKRFSGTLKLPYIPRQKYNLCLLGNQKHVDEAKALGLPAMTEADLKRLNKDKKLVKKLAASYNGFMASSTLIRKIPRLLGPGLNKAGKFPTVLGASDDITQKQKDIKSTIKFQLRNKKTLCLGVPVANVDMTPAEISANITLAINFMASLLSKNWQQLKKLYIKSTMGPVQCIYGF